MPRDPQKKLERLLTFQKFLQEHYEEQRKAAQRHSTTTSTSSAEDDELGKEQKKVELGSHDHAQLPQARPAPNTSAEGKSGSLLLTGPQDPASWFDLGSRTEGHPSATQVTKPEIGVFP